MPGSLRVVDSTRPQNSTRVFRKLRSRGGLFNGGLFSVKLFEHGLISRSRRGSDRWYDLSPSLSLSARRLFVIVFRKGFLRHFGHGWSWLYTRFNWEVKWNSKEKRGYRYRCDLWKMYIYIFLNVTWEKENVWNGEIIRIECEIISNVCICYYNIVEKLSSYCFRERRKRRFRIKIYDLLIS